MKRASNPQISLKPQDLVVLLKLATVQGALFTYAVLGRELRISASEVHSSLARARAAGLVAEADGAAVDLMRPAVREFVLHGARYAFPATRESIVRGVPTAHAAPFMRERITLSDEPPPVWPYAHGSVRGIALLPLYPSVPEATAKDPKLYEVLTLFDALRIGAAREREIASEALRKWLA